MSSLVKDHPDRFGGNVSPDARSRQVRTGLRILLTVISSLFFLLILAFFIRAQFPDWEHLSLPWQPLADTGQLWLNTGALVLASVAIQWARISARTDRPATTQIAFALAGILALAFLAGQLWVWRQLVAAGFYASANPANGFFYLLTGLHGLHLLGGMVAWSHTMVKLWRRHDSDTTAAPVLSIESCATYWHYLMILWFILFGLLISKPEVFAAIASFCGFAVS